MRNEEGKHRDTQEHHYLESLLAKTALHTSYDAPVRTI